MLGYVRFQGSVIHENNDCGSICIFITIQLLNTLRVGYYTLNGQRIGALSCPNSRSIFKHTSCDNIYTKLPEKNYIMRPRTLYVPERLLVLIFSMKKDGKLIPEPIFCDHINAIIMNEKVKI